jgi:hypothetical protein
MQRQEVGTSWEKQKANLKQNIEVSPLREPIFIGMGISPAHSLSSYGHLGSLQMVQNLQSTHVVCFLSFSQPTYPLLPCSTK